MPFRALLLPGKESVMGEDPGVARQPPRLRSTRERPIEGREADQEHRLGAVGVQAKCGERLEGLVLPKPHDRLQGVGWLESDEYDIEFAGRNFLAYLELLRRWKGECE